MSDLTEISGENQKEMLKLIATVAKKTANHHGIGHYDSETENAFPATTPPPINPKATTLKNTSIASRSTS